MKTKTPKSRVMWAIYTGHDPIVCGNRSLIRICERSAGVKAIRVAVVPLDDVEAIVERADNAYWADYRQSMAGDLTQIRAALTAAGIPCLTRKASK
jgi:hypothetical protein